MTRNSKLNVRQLQFLENQNLEDDSGFHIKKRTIAKALEIRDQSELPIPEPPFLKYGHSQEKFVETGQRDSQILRDALLQHGVDPEQGPGRILEFGCANARILRWFCDWAKYHEAWGVDLNAAQIFWCHQNLSPPFHFAVSTTAPHLFFEDRFFSLVFCMSVFTHIDDLYLSWICELRRVTQVGGFVYITIHDETTHEIQAARNSPNLKSRMKSNAYQEFLEQNSDFCAVGRDWKSMISFKRDYLLEHMANYFEIAGVFERALSQSQTAILLRRK